MKKWKSILQVGDIIQRRDGNFRMVVNQQCYAGIRGHISAQDYNENLQMKERAWEELDAVSVYRVPFTSEEIQDIKSTYGTYDEVALYKKHYNLFTDKLAMITAKNPKVQFIVPLKLPGIF